MQLKLTCRNLQISAPFFAAVEVSCHWPEFLTWRLLLLTEVFPCWSWVHSVLLIQVVKQSVS